MPQDGNLMRTSFRTPGFKTSGSKIRGGGHKPMAASLRPWGPHTWGLCLLVLLAVTGAVPAGAADVDVYQVRDLPVAEAAASEQKAKTQGIARAKEQAFSLLLKRLTPVTHHHRLPVVKLPELDNLVHGLSISDEKISHGAGRYLATVDVDFRPTAVRELLQDHDLSYAETRSRPLLILPILRSSGSALLWEADNPWFQAWRNQPPADGLVPLVVPEGDLRDIAVTRVQDILMGGDGGLGDLAARYRTQGLVVMAAYRNPGLPGASPAITVSVMVEAPGWEGFSWHRNFRGPPDLPEDELLTAAAGAVVSALEEGWKRKNLIDLSGETQILRVVAPLNSLHDWTSLRRDLLQTAVISDMTLERLSVKQAELQLKYLGTADQLKNALLQRNIGLRVSGPAGQADAWTQWQEEVWTLERLSQTGGQPGP